LAIQLLFESGIFCNRNLGILRDISILFLPEVFGLPSDIRLVISGKSVLESTSTFSLSPKHRASLASLQNDQLKARKYKISQNVSETETQSLRAGTGRQCLLTVFHTSDPRPQQPRKAVLHGLGNNKLILKQLSIKTETLSEQFQRFA
jgi:hypothetical protein